jgi:hypothetical protein
MDSVTVAATGGFAGSALTNSSGVYVLNGVPHGATGIILVPSKAGYTFAPESSLIAGPVIANITGQDFKDFTGTLNTYAITASAGTNGTISPAGVTIVGYGGSQAYTILPNSGYQVATLVIDSVGIAPASSYTFANVTADHTISATFSVASTNITATGTTYNFDNNGDGVTDMTMVFSTLPAGGGAVSVSIAPIVPPLPPASAIPFYLQFTSTLPNHAFNTTVSMDMFGVQGFGTTSYLMYYNAVTTSWVMISGAYLASDPGFGGHPSFTFATDHITAYTCINSATVPKNVFMSTSPSSLSPGVIYPNTTWSVTSYEPNDWSWSGTQAISLYIVPEPGSQFGACDITIEWSGSNLAFAGVDFGPNGNPNALFAPGNGYPVLTEYNQPGGTNRVRINASRQDLVNFTTVANDYIAKLNLTLTKPGYSAISVIGADFRAFVGDSSSVGVYVIPSQGAVRTYLGDLASSGNEATGDGRIDFEDLVPWSLSYWSGTPGFDLSRYKVKYDIGPTVDHSVFSLPVPDQKIEFEDLVLFSIAYGLSANHRLPKAVTSDSIDVSLGKPVVVGNETRIPLMVEGSVADLRALSIEVTGQFGSFLGVEKGELLEDYTTPVLLMNKTYDRTAYLDMAIVGVENAGLSSEGQMAILRFTGNPHVQLTVRSARNSNNVPIVARKKVGEGESVPTTFTLSQNYPNPFNPLTTIEYELPMPGNVTLEIFNVIGERVATLVNDVQEAGFYRVQWNGRDGNNIPVATGMYLYRVRSGEHVAVKKMLLLK